MKKHSTIVSIDAVTWSRESQGLFDYESQHVSKRSLKASSSAKIIRIKNDIRLITDMYNEKNVCENSKILAYLKHRDGVFTVTRKENSYNADRSSGTDNFWLVVKNIKKNGSNQEYTLKENDIIKLGRVKYRVKELNAFEKMESLQNIDKVENNDEREFSDTNSLEEDMPKQHLIKQVPESQELSCRICLNSENTEKNPLISPCGCAGSVKHVHLNCLKYWIKSKATIKSYGLCMAYSWKTLECELCHQTLPEIFIYRDNKIDLIDLPKPQSSYIILETVTKEKSSKTFYVLLATEKELIRLGRGNDCDVVINDISGSRFHAFIRYLDGKFYLGDNDSKFGTLVLLKNEMVLRPDYTMSIQVGRSVISFSLIHKNLQKTYEAPNVFNALSNLCVSDDPDENGQDMDRISYFFSRKKDSDFQDFIDTLEKVQLSGPNTKSNSPHLTTKKDEGASSLNSKLFNLTLNKDRDDYSHLQELLESQNKLRMNTNGRAKSSEDRRRERKNILNEMEYLNLGDEDDDEENSEEENGDVNMDFNTHDEGATLKV